MIPSRLAADPRGLAELKAQTAADSRSPSNQREVARQFEAIFAQMMIHSMRATHFADDGLGNAGQLYTSLFDQQIAQSMTQGKGLGLAQMLMRQFQGPAAASAGTATTSPVPTTAAGSTATVLRALNTSDHVTSAPVVPAAVDATSTTPAADTSSADSIPDRIRQFVDRLLPQAQSIAEKLGVSARVIIAQAALETGWGQHGVGAGGHNLFGIKATGNAPATTATTTEYIDGTPQRVTAHFSRYGSDTEALNGYARLIGDSPRYRAVVGSGDDAKRFATALQRAGYATDPKYAQKLQAVADSPHLSAAIDAATRTLRS